jgi:hypothetical protein
MPAAAGVAAIGAVADFTEVATAAALSQFEAGATVAALSQCAAAATVMPDTGIDAVSVRRRSARLLLALQRQGPIIAAAAATTPTATGFARGINIEAAIKTHSYAASPLLSVPSLTRFTVLGPRLCTQLPPAMARIGAAAGPEAAVTKNSVFSGENRARPVRA